MRCSRCGAESASAKKFCAECGSPLPRPCAKCGADNKPTSKFCEECGTTLDGKVAATFVGPPQFTSSSAEIRVSSELPDASRLDGERKTVTALFADIKGSTELMEDLDPEDARRIIDPSLTLMIDAVHRYDGYVVQSTGDGIFALFGAPVASEDHPQRALYAALRMQDELKRHSDRVCAEGGLPVQARIGINTGEVVVRSITTGKGHAEYTPIGHTTNLASRMQTLAPIGSTQGNPFFIEEMVQALFEQGVLRRNGEVNVTQSASMIRIPPTVQGVLASRIDRLPASEKDLLQTLAVLGKGFPLKRYSPINWMIT